MCQYNAKGMMTSALEALHLNDPTQSVLIVLDRSPGLLCFHQSFKEWNLSEILHESSKH